MAFRFWLFVGALSGLTSVLAAAYGAHGLTGITTSATALRIYQIAQEFQALHSVVLLGIATLITATDGGRGAFADWALQISAAAFLLGILLFCGGIYLGVVTGAQTGWLVPVGGAMFLLGWAALAISAFGFRRKPSET
jgi:uncharacterized membrane protein YgdD (TMEM256/DUF423 family)